MTISPLFSVIIPAYNRSELLSRALDSLDKQRFKDFEAIVCDNGSSDNIAEIIDRYQAKFNIKYIKITHWPIGPARARNTAIKSSNGSYLAFLDSDDWWYPEKLEVVSKYLPYGDIFFHDLDIYTKQGKKIFRKVKGRFLKKPVFSDLMMNENALMTSGVIVKREIFNQAGLFSEEEILEDFDLWLRISRVTDKFVYINNSLAAYWIDSGSVSGATDEFIRKQTATYGMYLDFLNEHERKQAVLMRAYLLARTKQRMGALAEALDLFRISAKANNLKIKLRSLIWIIIIQIKLKLYKQ